MSEERTTILTWTKKVVDPLHVAIEDIDIVDIAHALSLTCRYNGHTAGHLSVARHSVEVGLWLANEDVDTQLWGLLHDAAEAYIGDMVSPLKHRPEMQAFRDADDAIMRVIAERYKLPWPRPDIVGLGDTEIARREAEVRFSHWGNAEQDEMDFFTLFNRLRPDEVPKEEEEGEPVVTEADVLGRSFS